MPEKGPGYDWSGNPRATSMVRFAPIIGYDFLQLTQDYETNNEIDETVNKASDFILRNGYGHDGTSDCVTYRLGALECFSFNAAQAATSDMVVPSIGIDDKAFLNWLNNGRNINFEYGRTLRNSVGGMFTIVNYSLELLEVGKALPGIKDDPDRAVEAIRALWFKDLLLEMADASQAFWQTPDPTGSDKDIRTMPSRITDRLSKMLETLPPGLSENYGLFETNDNDEPVLSETIKAVMSRYKKHADGNTEVVRKDREKLFGPAAPWANRTSSGCPVRHSNIGAKAIEEVFTTEQTQVLVESGVITQAEDRGYELYDFFGFATEFVADHLEALNESLKASK